MKKPSRDLTKMRSINEYISQIEQVFDLAVEVTIEPPLNPGSQTCVGKALAWDKDDKDRASGPLYYSQGDVYVRDIRKAETNLLRVLSGLTFEAISDYPRTVQHDAVGASAPTKCTPTE